MNFLFPVETINRELDFRLALAAETLDTDDVAYIGRHDLLHALVPALRGGVYVGKNIFATSPPANLARYQSLREREIAVVYLHEEGAVFQGEEADWHRSLDDQFDMGVFGREDFICTWGDLQAAHCRNRNPALRDRIVVTGHPRFDLYAEPLRELYDLQRAELTNRYGQFVLINSNLSGANHGRGPESIFEWIASAEPGASRAYNLGSWRYQLEMLSRMVQLTHKLSLAFPNTQFVYRPHPSEDHGWYHSAFKGLQNVHVVHEGPVGPWILASTAMLHDGCTTALEAYFGGKLVINFHPIDESAYDVLLVNAIGTRCETEADAIEAVATALEGREVRSGNASPTARSLLRNLTERSMPILASVIDQARQELGNPPSSAVPTTALARISTSFRLRSFASRVLRRKARDHAYHQQKFGGLDITLVEARLRTLEVIHQKPLRLTHSSPLMLIITSPSSTQSDETGLVVG